MAPARWDTIGEFGDLSERGEGQPAKVHSQNALGVAGVRGAAEDQRRSSLGAGECEFFSDEIALGVGAVSVEVRVMTEAILVAGGGEGIIGNSWLTERVVAGQNREGRREQRVKSGGRSLRRNFALDPRQLAAGVQHHLLGLGRSPNRQRNDQSHRILERRSVVIGRGFGIWVLLELRGERRGEKGVFRMRRERERSKREGERMV